MSVGMVFIASLLLRAWGLWMAQDNTYQASDKDEASNVVFKSNLNAFVSPMAHLTLMFALDVAVILISSTGSTPVLISVLLAHVAVLVTSDQAVHLKIASLIHASAMLLALLLLSFALFLPCAVLSALTAAIPWTRKEALVVLGCAAMAVLYMIAVF